MNTSKVLITIIFIAMLFCQLYLISIIKESNDCKETTSNEFRFLPN